jgi:Ca2+-binding RTX toxin-like protein
MRRVALALAALALLAPGTAWADTVLQTTPTRLGTSVVVRGDGLGNRLTVSTAEGTRALTIVEEAPGGRIVSQDRTGSCSVEADGRRATCTFVLGLLVLGGDGDDALTSEMVSDVAMDGGNGADALTTRRYAATLSGGAGDDRLLGGPGMDSLDGGPGADVLAGSDGIDFLAGGERPDEMLGGRGRDRVTYADRVAAVSVTNDGARNDGERGEGDDVGRDVEWLEGGEGPDRLVGTSPGGRRGVTLVGGGGADTLTGSRGDDVLWGDRAAPASPIASAGDDVLVAGPGADELYGDGGNDRLDAGGIIRAQDGVPDRADCGTGDDSLVSDERDRALDCEQVRRFDSTAPKLLLHDLVREIRRATLASRGLRLLMRPSERVRLRARLTRRGGVVLGARSVVLRRGRVALRLRLRRPPPRRRATLGLTLTARDSAGNRSTLRYTIRVRP